MSLGRKEWIRKYYEEGENPDFPRCLTCKECRKSYTCRHRTRYFIIHLRVKHKITELNDHPQRAILVEIFKIVPSLQRGTCKLCEKEIQFNLDVFLLENHLRIFHDDNLVYKKMNELASEHEIWNKYIIMDNKITCTKCGYPIVKGVVSHPEETLQELFSHWRWHDKKFPGHIEILQPKKTEEMLKTSHKFFEKQVQNEIKSATNEPVPDPSTSTSMPVQNQVRQNIPTPPSIRQREKASDSPGNLQKKQAWEKKKYLHNLLQKIEKSKQKSQNVKKLLDNKAQETVWTENRSLLKQLAPGPSTSAGVSTE